MSRKTQEWRGKTDDTMPPPRVRQRIYDRANGVCHICTLPIKNGESWHADHVVALIAGGENRERNLAPAHGHCNLAKGVIEAKEKAKVAKVRQKHLGIKAPRQKIPARGFPSSDKPARAGKTQLPPRRLFAPVGQLWPQPQWREIDDRSE
jgi:5-methylcytosine-specific restriction enzyme A